MSKPGELDREEIKRDINKALGLAQKTRSSVLAWKHQAAIQAVAFLEEAEGNLNRGAIVEAYGGLCLVSGILFTCGVEESEMPWAFATNPPTDIIMFFVE